MTKQILYVGLDPYHYQTQGKIVHFPLIQIVPRSLNNPLVDQALKQFSIYTHVLLTSKSSISILANYLNTLNFSIQEWQTKKTCVIGKATAFALQQINVRPFAIAQEETAEGLIQLIQSMNLMASHFLWPHSSQTRSVLKNFFEKNSISYRSCPLYDPQPILYSNPPSLNAFDEVIFTSPSTVKSFFLNFLTIPSHLQMTAIGPVTKKYLDTQLQLLKKFN